MPDRLTLEQMCFSRPGGAVFTDVSLALSPGAAMIVSGKSGCGMSTLLAVCAGLIRPDRGKVAWNGIDIFSRPDELRDNARCRLGFVFAGNALIRNYSLSDNIALPLRYHSGATVDYARETVAAALARCGIARYAAALPEEAPSAVVRMAAICRAFILQPDLVLADEPDSGLDAADAAAVRTIFSQVHEAGCALMITTRRPEDWRDLGWTEAILKDGALHEEKI